ncbi:hypothetical protein V7S79_05945 [Aquirufa sp. ROCK-SH2]
MKKWGLLIFFLASILVIGISLTKISKANETQLEIRVVKATLSENTTPEHSTFPFKYTSPYAGEEDENEDEISSFEKLETSFIQTSPFYFDENSYKQYNPILGISDPYLNQVFTPPDFICS